LPNKPHWCEGFFVCGIMRANNRESYGRG